MEIHLDRLTKHYGNVSAVENLTLTLDDGRLLGLLGPSGCGKSTTLFMLAGLIQPTMGKILFGGEDVTALPPEKRGIGLVFQNYALYPHMTVQENILFPLLNLKIPRKKAAAMAEEMAEIVKIRDLMARKPRELSGGQQQRVAVARALVKKPKVLLLDEPLSNLDARLRVEMREEIRRVQQEVGITTVFVTHDQEEAMSISDRLAVMEKGVLQQYDTPLQVYRHPKNLFVAKFLGTTMNLLEMEVSGGHLLCGETLLRAQVPLPDGKVLAGIRPESFALSAAEAQDAFSAAVQSVAVAGRDLKVGFRIGGQQAYGLMESDRNAEIGGILRMRVKDGGIFLFDPKTQDVATQS